MKRRTANRTIAAALGLPLLARSGQTSLPVKPVHKTVKPKRLREKDLIGLISPGSYVDDKGLEQAVSNLEKMGFRVKLGNHIRMERGYTAGTDEQRLNDLHDAFNDPEVAAVWCVRGGYGCSRLLPAIDYRMIARNPKALIGYSDVTALINAIYFKTGLVGFHGPVGASRFTDFSELHLKTVLMEGPDTWKITRPDTFKEQSGKTFDFNTIQPGQAEGTLLGGNLSLLAAMAGTGYLPPFDQYLLFVEEVGEKPYRVDRMLTQLRQSNALGQVAGIALGIFADCEPDPDDRSLSLAQTLDDRLGDLSVPAAYGLPYGHIGDQGTLPVGIRARFDANEGSLTLLEPGVV
ncbi:S66 peptidase family protein [Flavilitoribacter nigricans]|uniref:LD-carboxypeptidase n=1 Tax=Flavilitoribacter nigricans (strain ATCC 23147 / DSM 23189 / NBRC 102662 / NCIMB 1420 / SS-2) TaxID=1122177 RepID=A0A2D0N541_FLAN2|nr:LD-carboxypeptidase [Flavilitoribacter nigricans]PHN03631.1 LD-carboxypeptidase [Flavilitoribacter nigricans DSM 23189 = NBRC 102662]